MPEGRTLVAGHASGLALVLDEPLSFWGGLDPASGALIDTHHPQQGATLAGRVLVMPSGRGSSSSSYVLAEAIRAGTSPVAIVLREPDGIVVLDADGYDAIADGEAIQVDAHEDDATVRLST
jgi:predicted aconitase with swiveling domain